MKARRPVAFLAFVDNRKQEKQNGIRSQKQETIIQY